jgi:hypothetical protein
MKDRTATIAIAIVVVLGLLLTAHLLVNQFDLAGVLRTMHGG